MPSISKMLPPRFNLAEQLRTGAIKKHVFKEVGAYKTLRELG